MKHLQPGDKMRAGKPYLMFSHGRAVCIGRVYEELAIPKPGEEIYNVYFWSDGSMWGWDWTMPDPTLIFELDQ